MLPIVRGKSEGALAALRRLRFFSGVASFLLLGCGSRNDCPQDNLCENRLTLAINVQDLASGSYQLQLTQLRPYDEDVLCELVVGEETSVEMTESCFWHGFEVDAAGKIKLTFLGRPQMLTVQFSRGTEELFREEGLRPDYDYADGCELCYFSTVEIAL